MRLQVFDSFPETGSCSHEYLSSKKAAQLGDARLALSLHPCTLPKAAWVGGPVLGPGDTDKSGVVCPPVPPQGAEQAGD